MQELIYVRAGGSRYRDADRVVINSTHHDFLQYRYVIGSPTGLGAVATRLMQTSVAGKDGAFLHGVLLDTRTVADTIQVVGKTRADMYEGRTHLQSVLNPKHGEGTLYYRNDFGEWKIAAIPSVYGDPAERIIRNRCHMKVSFFCQDPYWLDVNSSRMELFRQTDDGIPLPADLPAYFPKTINNRYVMNASDVDAHTIITVHGPLTGIRITNRTTGEQQICSVKLYEGDHITFDSQKDEILLTRRSGYQTSILPQCGHDPITLASGINDISVGIERALPGSSATIEWTRRFAGV